MTGAAHERRGLLRQTMMRQTGMAGEEDDTKQLASLDDDLWDRVVVLELGKQCLELEQSEELEKLDELDDTDELHQRGQSVCSKARIVAHAAVCGDGEEEVDR